MAQKQITWSVLTHGTSFGNYERTVLLETLELEITRDYQEYLRNKAVRISKILFFKLGLGHWQVLLIKGQFAKSFACSQNYHSHFIKDDGLQAFIWLNKFKPYEEIEINN